MTSFTIPNDIPPILEKIARWTRYLSILGFVMLSLSAIAVLSMGTLITGMNWYAAGMNDTMYVPGVFSWPYALSALIILIIYFIPLYYLYKFSANLKAALAQKDSFKLEMSFSFLLKHYKFIGIMTILILICYLLAFGILLAAAL